MDINSIETNHTKNGRKPLMAENLVETGDLIGPDPEVELNDAAEAGEVLTGDKAMPLTASDVI